MSNPTPIGESAVSAGQSRLITKTEESAPVARGISPIPGAAVAGPTPVGQTTQSAPPLVVDDPAQISAQRQQNVKNLTMLARQALGNGYDTMQVNPKMIADVCVEFERVVVDAGTEAAIPGMSDEMLVTAREEGRCAAVEEFAVERAQLLQQIADLGADVAAASSPTAPSDTGEFQGPGQAS